MIQPRAGHSHRYRRAVQRHRHRVAVRGPSTVTRRPPRPAPSTSATARRFSSLRACHLPRWGGACPIFFGASPCPSISKPLPLKPRPCRGELLDAESNPLTLSLRVSSASSATNCSTPSTAPIRRSIPANRRRTGKSSSPASGASCFPAQAEVVHAAAELLIDVANAPRSSTARWAAEDDRRHRHGRRPQRRRLPPHLVLSPPHLFTRWRRDPGDGSGRQSVGAQRAGYARQAHRCVSSWVCSPRVRSSSSWAA